MMNPMAMPANQGITNRAASDRSVPKDLIELLRLAKLQRDQQAAARAQALNAPRTPDTILAQLEEATGIASMAQGGMVPSYAEGGFVDKIKALLGMRDDSGVDTLDYIKDTIKGYEGFDSKQRLDNSPIDMIAGYGSNTFNDPKYEGKEITKNMAEEDLDSRLANEFIPSIEKVMGKNKTIDDLNPMLAASLTSLAYNYGPNWANKLPTLARLVASGDEEAIANEIERRGVDNKGINSNRRLSEADLIRRGTVGFNADIQNKPAMAQGGMIPSYAEGGEIENEIARKVQRAALGPIIRGGYMPDRALKGSPAYRQKEKEVAEEVYRDKVDNKFDDLLDRNKPQSDESFSYYKKLKEDFDKGVTAPEETLKIISSGKPPEAMQKDDRKGGKKSDVTGSDGAVDKILNKAVEDEKNLTDKVTPTDMDSLIQSILNPKDGPEDNKFEPESQSKLQTLADFLIGGAGTSNIGTTFANAAENMSAEADKDEAKQRAANKDDRADTFARKSLVLNSELKLSQIEATKILAERQMDAASVAVIQKNSDLIRAKINEISADVLGGSLELQELERKPETSEQAKQLRAVLQKQIDGQTAGYRKSLQENQAYLNKLVGIAPPTSQSSGLSSSRANSLLGK
tara:strand:- start:814 stop:2703 length:1890 start_codon:yes stop_codon:yes gene_type:complete